MSATVTNIATATGTFDDPDTTTDTDTATATVTARRLHDQRHQDADGDRVCRGDRPPTTSLSPTTATTFDWTGASSTTCSARSTHGRQSRRVTRHLHRLSPSAITGTSTIRSPPPDPSMTRQASSALGHRPGHGTRRPDCGGATLLIIDEDSIDNGIQFNPTGGLITPDGPSFFSDARTSTTTSRATRSVTCSATSRTTSGSTITLKTGQTGDEGWFAPNCIPRKWTRGHQQHLPHGRQRATTAIDNYFGRNGAGAIPAQCSWTRSRT